MRDILVMIGALLVTLWITVTGILLLTATCQPFTIYERILVATFYPSFCEGPRK